MRCGEECGSSCVCGAGGERFDSKSDVWCCGGADCEKDRSGDISCAKGVTQPLTIPCEGKCNDYSAGWAGARHYRICNKTLRQCVKTSQWTNRKIECLDRTDEEDDRSGAPPIDWEVKECDAYGYKSMPGLTCDGAGVYDDCLDYSYWCNEKYVASCGHLGGLTSLHQEVCGNHTYWHAKTCRWWDEEGVRCSSHYNGQCYYPNTTNWWLMKTCADGSDEIHTVGSICSNPADPNKCTSSCLTPTTGCTACTNPSYLTCKRKGVDVCLAPHLLCDLHPNCDGGQDEKDCMMEYKEKRLTSPYGTFPCDAPFYGPGNKITNATVRILAVRCDSEPECYEDQDEVGCQDKVLTRLELCKYLSHS